MNYEQIPMKRVQKINEFNCFNVKNALIKLMFEQNIVIKFYFTSI